MEGIKMGFKRNTNILKKSTYEKERTVMFQDVSMFMHEIEGNMCLQ